MPDNQPINNNANFPATIYKPSELLGMFTAYLSRQEVNSKVIFLRGIYLKNPKHDPRWVYRYDILFDADFFQIPARDGHPCLSGWTVPTTGAC